MDDEFVFNVDGAYNKITDWVDVGIFSDESLVISSVVKYVVGDSIVELSDWSFDCECVEIVDVIDNSGIIVVVCCIAVIAGFIQTKTKERHSQIFNYPKANLIRFRLVHSSAFLFYICSKLIVVWIIDDLRRFIDKDYFRFHTLDWLSCQKVKQICCFLFFVWAIS